MGTVCVNQGFIVLEQSSHTSHWHHLRERTHDGDDLATKELVGDGVAGHGAGAAVVSLEHEML